ncbi:MAG TPA: hypothetical protein VD735_07860 [Candidatus Saccharimonadales bacterium]|nr:hypothetical protein [Candidatus Saccharimonadales bacterium]
MNGVVVWQRQAIGDWLRLRNYQPPQNIVALADDTTMTDYSKHLFYLNHPVLEDKTDFNKHCTESGQETAVLGCYHGDRMGIYLYDVKDPRLNGARQVTAAHEMLHQAYDRLSSGERKRINALTADYYNSDAISKDIKEKIDSYRSQKDAVIPNEEHSILGSEVRDLPADLEAYYSQYFSNRSKLVAYAEAYRGEFTRRKELVDQYDKQLTSLKTQIDANKADLETRLRALKAKEAEINADAAQSDSAAYQADVQSYNDQVRGYNTKINNTRDLIDTYNTTVAKRNDIAIEEQQLQKALDSRLTPAVTQ